MQDDTELENGDTDQLLGGLVVPNDRVARTGGDVTGAVARHELALLVDGGRLGAAGSGWRVRVPVTMLVGVRVVVAV